MDHRPRVRSRRPHLAVALAALALTGCGGSSTTESPPAVVELGWVETARIDGYPLLRFEVRRARVYLQRWELDATIANRSRYTYEIAPPPRAPAFPNWIGVAQFETDDIREVESLGSAPRILHGETFEPPLPDELPPGASWRGRIGGPGALAPGRFVRATFGMFRSDDEAVPPEVQSFAWITDHAFSVPARQN